MVETFSACGGDGLKRSESEDGSSGALRLFVLREQYQFFKKVLGRGRGERLFLKKVLPRILSFLI